jgi:putative FmdB family regulatory protein
MPLFEYRCEDCRRRFTLLVGMTAQAVEQACPRCGGAKIRKLISRFAVARSEDDLLESVADPNALGDPEDPRAMADWMRRIGREMGEDLGDDFDEMVEEAVREEMEGGPGADGDDGSAEGGGAGDLATDL